MATILGWVAVTRIRRSAGKLWGMGLALFDGLLFPLMVLDIALLSLAVIVLDSVIYDPAIVKPSDDPVFILSMAVVIALIGWLDFMVVRRVWRKVSNALKKPPRQRMNQDGRYRRLKWIGYIAFYCAFLSALVPTIFYWLRPWAAPWMTIPRLRRCL